MQARPSMISPNTRTALAAEAWNEQIIAIRLLVTTALPADLGVAGEPLTQFTETLTTFLMTQRSANNFISFTKETWARDSVLKETAKKNIQTAITKYAELDHTSRGVYCQSFTGTSLEAAHAAAIAAANAERVAINPIGAANQTPAHGGGGGEAPRNQHHATPAGFQSPFVPNQNGPGICHALWLRMCCCRRVQARRLAPTVGTPLFNPADAKIQEDYRSIAPHSAQEETASSEHTRRQLFPRTWLEETMAYPKEHPVQMILNVAFIIQLCTIGVRGINRWISQGWDPRGFTIEGETNISNATSPDSSTEAGKSTDARKELQASGKIHVVVTSNGGATFQMAPADELASSIEVTALEDNLTDVSETANQGVTAAATAQDAADDAQKAALAAQATANAAQNGDITFTFGTASLKATAAPCAPGQEPFFRAIPVPGNPGAFKAGAPQCLEIPTSKATTSEDCQSGPVKMTKDVATNVLINCKDLENLGVAVKGLTEDTCQVGFEVNDGMSSPTGPGLESLGNGYFAYPPVPCNDAAVAQAVINAMVKTDFACTGTATNPEPPVIKIFSGNHQNITVNAPNGSPYGSRMPITCLVGEEAPLETAVPKATSKKQTPNAPAPNTYTLVRTGEPSKKEIGQQNTLRKALKKLYANFDPDQKIKYELNNNERKKLERFFKDDWEEIEDVIDADDPYQYVPACLSQKISSVIGQLGGDWQPPRNLLELAIASSSMAFEPRGLMLPHDAAAVRTSAQLPSANTANEEVLLYGGVALAVGAIVALGALARRRCRSTEPENAV